MVSYVIISQPRTGSTLLSSMLRNRGLGDPREYFSDKEISLNWTAIRPEPFVAPQYVAFLRSRCASPGHFGIKIHYYQLAKYMPGRPGMLSFLDGFERVMVLTRSNKLAQAVSAMRALQTDQWTASAHRQRDEPRFEPAAIAENIRRFLHQEHLTDALLAGREVLRITYEGISDADSGEWSRIQKFLGVSPAPVSAAIMSGGVQRDELSEEFGRRFLGLIQGH